MRHLCKQWVMCLVFGLPLGPPLGNKMLGHEHDFTSQNDAPWSHAASVPEGFSILISVGTCLQSEGVMGPGQPALPLL